VLKDPANVSGISLITPTDVGGLSSTAPLEGSFIIECPHPDNVLATVSTPELDIKRWTPGVEYEISKSIPFLASKIYLREMKVKDQDYWENARKFAITFVDLEQDVPQCTIKSGVITPMTGNNVQFSSQTLQEYGQTIMFEPIPMEMLYAAATKPQILVNVDGIPAACANLNCDYLYVDLPSLVTSQSLTGNTLTIGGTNLPTNLLDVKLGDVGCGPTTSDGTQIVCTLLSGASAGTYDKVEVLTPDGRIPVDAAAL